METPVGPMYFETMFELTRAQAIFLGAFIFSVYLGGVILALRKARRYIDAMDDNSKS